MFVALLVPYFKGAEFAVTKRAFSVRNWGFSVRNWGFSVRN
jgi:hypothetical protein